MKYYHWVLIVGVCTFAEISLGAEIDYAPGELIVRYRDRALNKERMSVSELDHLNNNLRQIHRHAGLISAKPLFESSPQRGDTQDPVRDGFGHPLATTYCLKFEKNGLELEQLAKEYAQDPAVLYAEPNYCWELASVPDDPQYSQQWYHQNISSEGGWSVETGSNDVVIAIIDTGVDWNHPDLAINIWSNSAEDATNGIDDDLNGYVDDCRGWDFVNVTQTNSFAAGEDIGPEDNDPMDFYGHGTVVAGVATAVGSNGIGVAGVSWHCKVMPLRVGAAERSSGNAYILSSWIAEAICYAVDNGADIINLSLVDNNWPHVGPGAVKDAIDYAYSNDLVVVASAGNYGTDSEIYPAAYYKVIGVAATDDQDRRSVWGTPQPPLWHGVSSCHGTWVTVAAPGSAILTTGYDDSYESRNGTSLAAPVVAGLAGLIRSQHPEFDNEEVRAVIAATADVPDSEKYLGTGRINVSNALAMTAVPLADIATPVMEYVVSSNIDVTGTAAGGDFASYSLRYGKGIYPDSWSWIQYGTTAVSNGVLGTWNVTGLDDNAVYTLRLEVSDSLGNTSVSESIVVLQKNVQPGWPKTLAGSIRNDGIAVGDVDGDGTMEMAVYTIYYTGNGNGYDMHLFHHDGTPVVGWPFTNMPVKGLSSPTIADINMDGEGEVIFSSVRLVSYPVYATTYHVYDGNGQPVAGWPQENESTNYYSVTSPSVGDLDGDGVPEIVFTSRKESKQDRSMIVVYEPDGSLVPGWPQYVELNFPPAHGTVQDQATHANLVDLDGDDDLEIVVAVSTYGQSQVYAYHHDGSVVAGWPVTQPNGYVVHSVCGDLDGNGDMEIIGATGDGDIYAWHGDGTPLSGWPVFVPVVGGLTVPSLADLDADGDVELVVHTKGDKNYAYHHDGTLVAGWPVDTLSYAGGGYWPETVIGDIDNDREPEIVQVSGDEAAIYAWHVDGTTVSNWPMTIPAPSYVTPVMWDLDNDGQLELAVAYGDTLNVFALGVPFEPNELQWPMIWGDEPRTARYALPDVDDDGMPDWWEEEVFGGTEGSDPAGDDDGDGVGNWAEFIAGTHPTNGASVFQCESLVQNAADSDEFVLNWSSVSNRFYDIWRCSDLVDGEWEVVGLDLVATPPLNIYTDNVDEAGAYLYRLEVRRH